jgi:hypothetical protein
MKFVVSIVMKMQIMIIWVVITYVLKVVINISDICTISILYLEDGADTVLKNV